MSECKIDLSKITQGSISSKKSKKGKVYSVEIIGELSSERAVVLTGDRK